MAQVLVRNLDKKTVDRLKARARRNGRSLEAELRVILEREAEARVGEEAVPYRTERNDTWAALERIAARWPALELPEKRGPVRTPKPIKIKGKPLSKSIIEDRE